MDPFAKEHQLLEDAVAALRRNVDLKANILHAPKTPGRFQADGLLEIEFNGQKQRFVVEVKTVDRNIAVGQIQAQLQGLIQNLYPDYLPLLITGFATPGVAAECRRLNLPYLDTVGNIYLRTDKLFLDIRGNAKPAQVFKTDYRATHAAGLKITFALLCRPTLAGAQYRELARIANVGLGTVGPVLDDLTRREFLQKGKTPNGNLIRREELIKEWVTYYPANLRPTLHPRRYQAERELLLPLELNTFGAYWGGEYGAEKLTRHLKAERFLIYAQAVPPVLMKRARMRLAPDGNVEMLQMFWNENLTGPNLAVAPPLLVYADLIATAEPRNLETAKEIYERFLQNPADQP
jgi:hypothetical protein